MRTYNLTPCQISAARHGLPFGADRQSSSDVRWDMVKGLVAVTTICVNQRRVVPRHLYGVVEDGSGYSIAVYWHIRKDISWIPWYSLTTLRRYAHTGQITELERGLSYADMVRRVRKDFPTLAIPDFATFYAQFGLNVMQAREENGDDGSE